MKGIKEMAIAFLHSYVTPFSFHDGPKQMAAQLYAVVTPFEFKEEGKKGQYMLCIGLYMLGEGGALEIGW